MTATATKHDRICEQTFQSSTRTLTVTEIEGGDIIEIKPVRVLNPISKNGGEYKQRAMESAARLVDRTRVSIEHTGKDGRKYVDRHGQLREGRFVGDGVDATLWINKGAPLAEKIRIDAKHFPENICLSIELPQDGWVGEDNRHKGSGYIVEDIKHWDDVAIVADGGTTKSLTESVHEDDEMAQTPQAGIDEGKMRDLLASAVKESDQRREIQEKIDTLTRKVDDQSAVIEALTKERDELKAAEETRKHVETRVTELIEEAKQLNAGDISPEYAKTLATMPKDAATFTLQERAKYIGNEGRNDQSDSDSQKPNFNAPSVGNQSRKNEDSQFAWL